MWKFYDALWTLLHPLRRTSLKSLSLTAMRGVIFLLRAGQEWTDSPLFSPRLKNCISLILKFYLAVNPFRISGVFLEFCSCVATDLRLSQICCYLFPSKDSSKLHQAWALNSWGPCLQKWSSQFKRFNWDSMFLTVPRGGLWSLGNLHKYRWFRRLFFISGRKKTAVWICPQMLRPRHGIATLEKITPAGIFTFSL